MSEQNENKDDLLELIDSLDIDKDLNRKMDLFTQKKRNWEIQKEKKSVKEGKSTVFYDNGDTIKTVVRRNPQSAGSGTKTIVFETPGDDTKNAGGGTVVIGEKEIQNFIEEEKVVPKPQQSDLKEEDSEPFNKKIVYIIFTVLLGLLLCFGVYRFVIGVSNQSDNTSEETNEYYTEVKTWAENYDSLTDSEKAQVIDLESKFNKLDDDQKAEINSILKEKTGFTFDELLADAKSGEQTSKKNNNTELAEQKAALKSQISDLEKQLAQAETNLNTANDEMNKAQSDFDSWTTSVDNSAAAVSEAGTAYQNAYETSDNPETDEEVKKLADALAKAQTQYDSDYTSYTNSYATLQEKQVNAQNAQGTYDSLYAQYSELQAQLAALDS